MPDGWDPGGSTWDGGAAGGSAARGLLVDGNWSDMKSTKRMRKQGQSSARISPHYCHGRTPCDKHSLSGPVDFPPPPGHNDRP